MGFREVKKEHTEEHEYICNVHDEELCCTCLQQKYFLDVIEHIRQMLDQSAHMEKLVELCTKVIAKIKFTVKGLADQADNKELFGLLKVLKTIKKICSRFKEDIENGLVFRFDLYLNHITDRRAVYLNELERVSSDVPNLIKRTLMLRKLNLLKKISKPKAKTLKSLQIQLSKFHTLERSSLDKNLSEGRLKSKLELQARKSLASLVQNP